MKGSGEKGDVYILPVLVPAEGLLNQIASRHEAELSGEAIVSGPRRAQPDLVTPRWLVAHPFSASTTPAK
jgi:hypothetical protein